MNTVDITDFVCGCATYALRRTGSRLSLDMLRFGYGKKFNDWAELGEGDIVCWETEDPSAINELPVVIEGDRLLNHRILINRHFAVFESGGFVSDLTYFTDRVGNMWPCLRMRKIKNLSDPDFYFSFSAAARVE